MKKSLKWIANIAVTAVVTTALLCTSAWFAHSKGFVTCSDSTCECREVQKNDSEQADNASTGTQDPKED